MACGGGGLRPAERELPFIAGNGLELHDQCFVRAAGDGRAIVHLDGDKLIRDGGDRGRFRHGR